MPIFNYTIDMLHTILLLSYFVMAASFAAPYATPMMNIMEKMYFTHSNVNKNSNFKDLPSNKIKDAFDVISQKEGYCFMATISKDKSIENYPFGSVTGYALNEYGSPIFALSKMSRHTKNIYENSAVSMVILEKNKIEDAFQKRVVITGNIKKVNNDIVDFDYVVPSDKTINLKDQYTKYHPNSMWVDFPDVSMYILDEIKDIYYISGPAQTAKINPIHYNNYIEFSNLNL